MESLMTTRCRRPRTPCQLSFFSINEADGEERVKVHEDGELIMKCITKYVTITSLEYSLV